MCCGINFVNFFINKSKIKQHKEAENTLDGEIIEDKKDEL